MPCLPGSARGGRCDHRRRTRTSGTRYRLADGGHDILVPEDQVDATRVPIAGRDLPLQGTVGFELFNDSSTWASPNSPSDQFAARAAGRAAANDHEHRRRRERPGPSRAWRADSVPRRPPQRHGLGDGAQRPGRRLAPTTVRGIQRLVAGSVPDWPPRSPCSTTGAPWSAAESPAEGRPRALRRGTAASSASSRPGSAARWSALPRRRDGGQCLGQGGTRPGAGRGAAPIDPAAKSRNYRLRATVAIARAP